MTDIGTGLRQRQPRAVDEAYLYFVRSRGCLRCGRTAEAAHVRISCLERGKRPTGLGERPDDRWALPLCHRHHMEQHAMGEERWWAMWGVDPIEQCVSLYEEYLAL